MSAEVVAYAWVPDGIPTIFTSDEGLSTAWAIAAGFEAVHPGLRLPSGLGCGIDLRSGLLTDDTATIAIEDLDGTLATLFRSARADAEPLTNTLEPSDAGGVQVQGKHVGTEFVSAGGLRRRYSCVPGYAVGLKHYGQVEAYSNSLGSTPVSSQPLLWAGRRCAVYRVLQVGGVWQALSSAKRVWWGAMRGAGSYRRGVWSFACFGLQSWTAGNIGRGLFEDPLRAVPITPIDADAGQHRLFSFLTVYNALTGETHHDYGDLVDDTYLVGAEGYADCATALNNFLADVVADVSGGNAFNADGNIIRFETEPGLDGVVVNWKRGDVLADGDPNVEASDGSQLCARLVTWAHENVWRTLGYDVRTQNSDRDPVANEDQYGRFHPVGDQGYWAGEFWSCSPKAMLAVETQNFDIATTPQAEYANGGADRRWPPIYPGGAVTFTGEPLQEFELVAADPVLLAGSKSRPLPADPDDDTAPYTIGGGVGAVTDQALLVLEGPYRRRGDEDQVDPVAGYAFEVEKERRLGKTVQVVRVAYKRNSDGTVSFGSGNNPRFVVMEWYPPRLFGFDFSPLQGTWGAFRDAPPDAENITARPLVALETGTAGGDLISEVIQRVMLTTGTAGEWYADAGLTVPLYGLDGDEAYLDVGVNDSGGTVPKDAEDATLGLGIPASMVESPAHFSAVEDLALGPELRRCKVAAIGVTGARDLFSRLLAPTGLSLSLSGGKYGLIDAWALPSPGDSVLTITPELYAGKAGKPESATPTQALRKWAPLDKVEIKARVDPATHEYAVTAERSATDGGACYRQHQQTRHQVLADFVIDQRLPAVTGHNWISDFGVRWRRGFEFWAEDNSEVVAKLHVYDAIDIWPGDAVLVTDSQMVGSDGEYGLSVAPGRVLGRIFDASSESITLRILVAGEANFRLYAPAASVSRYVENEGGVGYRLEVDDDYLGDRGGLTYDVEGFAEPAWSSEGGDALIEVFQFDGSSWSGGIYGTVDSINTAVSACYIQLSGALSGATYYRDRWSIVVLRDWADQTAAWVLRWLAPITLDDGTADGGPGEKFNGL